MLKWLFNSPSTNNIDLSAIAVDMHSHMVPGVDDGVETIEESILMAGKLEELGYQTVYTTPHIMWDCYRNTPEIIRKGVEDVNNALAKTSIGVRLHAAAEYFLDEHFNDLLDNDQELLTLPGNRLLVELPYSTPLLNVSETLFRIAQKGFQPVLAHPERYTYYHSDLPVFRKFADQGCELQMNILSITGHYGEGVERTARWLLQNNLITLVGTDAHRPGHLDLIKKMQSSKLFRNYNFRNKDVLI
ncbi:tyrosine-protein phosphatase [Dyadobacter aurulentus]|uniref:tyrosine-protein phosphatase n=1 Tax=Dyadobacter sp. UC 10 TaxID=2605428 RepID=UPI0011F1852B|nr:CpsB/CapC family capsule biosynthesis tyrosine phosphatase [Dyadobacter sp. UC 10]KAA0988861.1 histidinol phosphatase [Dyadobacter sp. UC 10]